MDCQHKHDSKAHGCCGHGGHCCRTHQAISITREERAFLMRLAQIPFLPLARFILVSSRSSHIQVTALAPVHLTASDQSLEQIRKTGTILLGLEHKGLISLDYDQPLQGCDYAEYRDSGAYRFLQESVREGCKKENFLFDQARLELGSIALTALGRRLVELPALSSP